MQYKKQAINANKILESSRPLFLFYNDRAHWDKKLIDATTETELNRAIQEAHKNNVLAETAAAVDKERHRLRP